MKKIALIGAMLMVLGLASQALACGIGKSADDKGSVAGYDFSISGTAPTSTPASPAV